MMKFFLLAICVPLIASPSIQTAREQAPAPADSAFLATTWQTSAALLAADKLATQRLTDPANTAFATRDIIRLSGLRQQLQTLSRKAGQPRLIDRGLLHRDTTLEKFTGHRFDSAWLEQQLTGYQQLIQFFRTEKLQGHDPRCITMSVQLLESYRQRLLTLRDLWTKPANPDKLFPPKRTAKKKDG